jgi:hypothetical protein
MNPVEERIRAALTADAEAVDPDTIRALPEPSAMAAASRGRARNRRARLLVPAASAVAVAAIAVAATVLVPGTGTGPAARHSGGAAAQPLPYPGYFVALTAGPGNLAVASATTGRQTAIVKPPSGYTFGAVGAAGTRAFVAAAWPCLRSDCASSSPPADQAIRPATEGHHRRVQLARRSPSGPHGHGCWTRFYRFSVTAAGRPAALTPLPGGRIDELVSAVAASGNGRLIAYVGQGCAAGGSPTYLTVRSTVTGKTTSWQAPEREVFSPPSLTASGSLVGYSTPLIKRIPSIAGIIQATAQPGSLAARGRIVVRATEFGPSTEIMSAALAPDGNTLYFTTNPTGSALARNETWQLRGYQLRTGRTVQIRRFPGVARQIAAEPSGRYLLLEDSTGSQFQTLRLARLDIATGQVRYLRASWIGGDGGAADVAW